MQEELNAFERNEELEANEMVLMKNEGLTNTKAQVWIKNVN